LQGKLELITGIPVGNQKLAIYHDDADLQPVKDIDDDQRPLGFYSPADFQVLKVRAGAVISSDLRRMLIF
jgi:tubulin-specific chaperone B